MNTRIFFAPDDQENKASNITPDPIIPVPAGSDASVHRSLIPTKEADLGAVAKNVATDWANHPELPLMWMNQGEFLTISNNYYGLVSTSSGTKGKKSKQKSELDLLDAQINKGVGKIRGWLKDKYEDRRTDFYANYGIEHKKGRWPFPTNRERRLIVLDLIITNVTIDGFDKKEKYDLAFWTKMKTDYAAELAKSTVVNTTGSKIVGNKKELRAQVEDVLKNLLKIIQGNYRSTYYAVALSMGYRKTGQ